MKEMKKNAVWTLLGLVVLLLGGIGYLFSFPNKARAYLIPHVPYWGQYTEAGLATSPLFSLYTMLQYWGDGRFTPERLVELVQFDSPLDLTGASMFFTRNGYDPQLLYTQEINDLRPFLKKNIPLILRQRLALDAPEYLTTMRVLIGFDDARRVLIFHDYLFGNNYEISYVDHELLKKPTLGTLVVTPGSDVKKGLAKTDFADEYPARLPIMDSPLLRDLFIKREEILYLVYQTPRTADISERIQQLGDAILSHEGFKDLHPAERVRLSTRHARSMHQAGDYKRAVDILRITVPLLTDDITRPFNGWRVPLSQGPSLREAAWRFLGDAYQKLGDTDSAREAYEQVLLIED